MASESLFRVRWIRNTIRNVTIVVLVLITSCHVSENANTGPSSAHITTTPSAIPNAVVVPVNLVIVVEKPSNRSARDIRVRLAMRGIINGSRDGCGTPSSAIRRAIEAAGGGALHFRGIHESARSPHPVRGEMFSIAEDPRTPSLSTA